MRLPRPWLQLASLFDCLDDVLAWVKDRDGRYGWVNRAFLINYSLDVRRDGAVPELGDVVGKTDYDFSPAFLADQFRLDDEYVLAGNRIVNRIELVGQPDGLAVWNVTNKVPLVDDQGAVIGTAGITRPLATPGEDVAAGARVRPGPGLPARPLQHADHESATRPTGSYVGPSVRAQVPREFPPDAPEIPAQAPAAGWRAGPWSIPARPWRRSPRAAGSPTRATSRGSSAATSAGRPANIASTTPGGEAMPLPFQNLPLTIKSRIDGRRYSPASSDRADRARAIEEPP